MSWTPDCCPHCGVLPKNCNLSCQRERIAELAAKTIALDEAFATIERSRQRVADMTRALEAAKVAFRGYEVHHRAKGADTKAETNRKLADMCISVLSSSDSK